MNDLLSLKVSIAVLLTPFILGLWCLSIRWAWQRYRALARMVKYHKTPETQKQVEKYLALEVGVGFERSARGAADIMKIVY